MNTAFIKFVKGVLLLAFLVFWTSRDAAAVQYTPYVVAQDVAVSVINGQVRFCERANLRGLVCGGRVKVFGKAREVIRDWWTPETYVAAVTHIQDPVVVNVTPTGDGEGIVIYFEAP